jgi:hypothetical protein
MITSLPASLPHIKTGTLCSAAINEAGFNQAPTVA